MTDEYNDGYTHEALHTVHVLMDTFHNNVVETRCCEEFADVKDAALAVHTAMFALYQLIGSKYEALKS
jgi:hypothetical protein